MEIAELVNQYGLPTVMAVGMGYFIFYVWKFVSTVLKPALGEMHMALIRVIDQTRVIIYGAGSSGIQLKAAFSYSNEIKVSCFIDLYR